MENKQIVVSFIMPVYNGEDFLKRSISSIIMQPNKNYELIIINDGSTDNSVQIINEYINEYNCISLIDIDNHGVNYARNIGIKTAKGKYLCFIDQDDFIFEKAFNDELVNKLNKSYDDNVDFYTMKNVVSNEKCNRFFLQEVKIRSESNNNEHKIIYGLTTTNPLFAFYNSDTFKKIDLSIFEQYRNTDTDMQLFHLFYYYSLKCIFDNDLVFYCWVNNLQSVSHDTSRLSNSHYDTLLCWKEMAEIHKKKHKDDDAMKYCIAYLCGVYYYYLLSSFRNIKSIIKSDIVIDEFDNYVRQNYKLFAWGEPKKELEKYYKHKVLFKSKCLLNNKKNSIGRMMKNSIPYIRNRYENNKFPLTIDKL